MEALNWIAVIVGAVAAFFVGWAVYSPFLFGPKWAEGSGVEMGTASEMPIFAMVMQFAALLLLSLVVGMLVPAGLVSVAIVATLAAAAFSISGGKFVKKSTYAVAVDGGYITASGIVMIVIHSML